MKKALANEFHTRSYNFAIVVAFSLLNVITVLFDVKFSVGNMPLMTILAYNIFDFPFNKQDNNSSWKNFERAFPFTVFQRVTAKFIFAVLQGLIVFAVISATSIYADVYLLDAVNTLIPLPYIGKMSEMQKVLMFAALYFCLINLIIAFVFFVSNLFSRHLSAISYIAVCGMMCFAYMYISLRFINNFSTLFYALSEAYWLLAVVVVASVLVLLASWFAVLSIETVNSKERKTKLRSNALTLAAVAVLAVGVGIGVAYSQGAIKMFEKEDYTTTRSDNYEDYTTDPPISEEDNEAAMDIVMDFLAKEAPFVGINKESFEEKLETIEFYPSENAEDSYLRENTRVNLKMWCDEATGTVVDNFSVGNYCTGENIFKTATAQDMEDFFAAFSEGTSEKEMLEMLKTQKIYPDLMNEYYDYAPGEEDLVPVRHYWIEIEVESYNGEGEADFTLDINTANGEIIYSSGYQN